MTRMLICIICFALILSSITLASGQNTASEWAEAEIVKAKETGYAQEYLFSDYGRNITRLEFAELAVRFVAYNLGYTLEEFKKEYSLDGTGDLFYDTDSEFATIAAKMGIVFGRKERIFDSYADITREEAAAMLSRIYGCYSSFMSYENTEYEDAVEFSEWAYYDIQFVSGNGIMKGVSQTKFDPHGEYTREQALATFVRLGQVEEWKNNEGAYLAKMTCEQRVEKILSKDFIMLIERIESDCGTVLYLTLTGVPHGPSYYLIFVDNNGKPHELSAPVPRQTGWGSMPEHNNLRLSEDGKKLCFEISFAERAVIQADGEKVLHEAGTYYFEADLIKAETVLLKFEAAE